MKTEKLKGIDGWLLLFIIVLVFITPLYSILEVFMYPEFYYYSSGVLSYSTITFLILINIWYVFVGVSLWMKKLKAVIWAKECLIATLILNIFLIFYSYGFFTVEESDIIFGEFFRSIIFFIVWFSYLNKSKRVANTFKERKLEIKRVVSISAIVIVVVLIISTFIQPDITNDLENMTFDSSSPIYGTLSSTYTQYVEFVYQDFSRDLNLEFESFNGVIDVYFVKSEKDYDKFSTGETFTMYDGCFSASKSSGIISCTVSTGGIIIYNPNLNEVEYTLIVR